MSKSGRVRLGELRRAFRLVSECRDLGHDPAAWRRRLLEGLDALVGYQVGAAVRFRHDPATGLPEACPLAEHGWDSPRERSLWHENFLINRGFDWAITFRRFMALPGDLVTRTRGQLVEDREWDRSFEFLETRRPMGHDDLMVSYARAPDGEGLYGFTLNRSLGDGPFTTREGRLVHMLHHELARSFGTTVAIEPGGVFEGLPRRLGETLQALVEGDSEKQVAARLGLSRHTVHEYIKDLYRRLAVNSRAELLALCIKHRRPTAAGGAPGLGIPGRRPGGPG